MADLKGFSPQGVVHVVVNNQIGFTTTPREFRSGYQSTEVTKCVECPIFHVNGDEPDLVDQVM
jgi:2-oxoglutarate dehydrogenase complex dehydrogenase (E1) component-like enzyme